MGFLSNLRLRAVGSVVTFCGEAPSVCEAADCSVAAKADLPEAAGVEPAQTASSEGSAVLTVADSSAAL